ncbi:MAG TPA: hypothetical protein VK894_10820 [Jiangellales bacterium]|nr:hypothetical protein [Jiangellales bacterium]
MRRFADPERCPDCGAGITGSMSRCGTCRLPLRTAEGERLWQLLLAADASLGRLRAEQDRELAATPGGSGPARGPAAPPRMPYAHPPAPPQTPPEARWAPVRTAPTSPARRPLSVPVILLGLGGLCLVVAAVVFVAVTWGRLSLGVRTSLLILATLAIAAAATLAVRRRLRVTAEVLALVTAGFVVIDLAAARVADLLGLGGVTAWAYQATCGVLVAVLAATGARAARGHLPRLVGAEVVTVAATSVAVAAVAQGWTGPGSTYAALTALVVALLATVLALAGLRVAAAGTAALALVLWLVLVTLTLVEVYSAPTIESAWLSAEGAGLLAAAGMAAVVARVPWPARRRALAVAGAVAATVLAALWLWAPAADERASLSVLSAAALALAAAVGTRGAPEPWAAGLRGAAGVGVVAVGAAVLAVLGPSVDAVMAVAETPWSMSPGSPVDRPPGPTEGSPWWAAVAAVVVASAVLAALPPARRLERRAAAELAGAVAALAVGATVITAEAPLAVAAAVAVILGSACLLAGMRRSPVSRDGIVAALALALAGGVLLVAGTVLAVGSRPVAGAAWPAVAAVAALASIWARGPVRTAAAAVAVPLAALATVPWTAAAGASTPVRAFAAAGVAAAALVAAQVQPVRRDRDLRPGLEIGGAVAAVVALAWSTGAPWWLAATLTLVGAALVVAALVADDRRWAGWPGGLLLAAASWVRLSDAGVDDVEAYTLPSALALLVVGVLAMRRDPARASLPTLGPGLLLALGPSLVLSVQDPVSVRGLLTGLAGLALVAAGVALRWGAVLVAGGVVTAVLAVRHLTPVAAGLPRWVLLGVAGAALLAVGATWEQRRRDVGAAARYVAALR